MPDFDRRDKREEGGPKSDLRAEDQAGIKTPEGAGEESIFLLPDPPPAAGVLGKSARVLLIARLEIIEEWLPKRFLNRERWGAVCKALVADDRIPSNLSGERFVSDMISRVASLPAQAEGSPPGPIHGWSDEQKAALIHQIPEVLSAVCCTGDESRLYAEFLLEARSAVESFKATGSRFTPERDGLLLHLENKSLERHLDHLTDLTLKGCDRRKAPARIAELKQRVYTLQALSASSKKTRISFAFHEIEGQLSSVRALVKAGRLSWEGLQALRAFEEYLKLLREKVEERIG